MDFREMKRKKERGVSNEEFMDDCKEDYKNAENIVVIGIDPSGVVSTHYTQSSSLAVIGMMEIAKAQLLDELKI